MPIYLTGKGKCLSNEIRERLWRCNFHNNVSCVQYNHIFVDYSIFSFFFFFPVGSRKQEKESDILGNFCTPGTRQKNKYSGCYLWALGQNCMKARHASVVVGSGTLLTTIVSEWVLSLQSKKDRLIITTGKIKKYNITSLKYVIWFLFVG